MTVTQIGFVAAALAAAGYGLVLEPRRPSLLRTLVKVAGAVALSATARLGDAPTFLGLALALSAVSDAAFAADQNRYLSAGLGALLGARLAYAVLFAEIGRPALLFIDPVRACAALAIAIVAATLALRLRPSPGPARAPAVAGAAATAAMAGLAVSLSWSFWPALLGAVLLLASDAALAARRLGEGGRWSTATDQAVWWLYVAGQGAIAWAFLRPW